MPKRRKNPAAVILGKLRALKRWKLPNPKLMRQLTVTKHAAGVALGRLGGLKGGKARAEKLTAAARSRIASRAVKARWEEWKREKPPLA
jgi:hypothetical protein